MAKLNAAKRNALPGSDFAGPDRSYPIENASHARNALARSSEFADSAEKAEIISAVRRKFPSMKLRGLNK